MDAILLRTRIIVWKLKQNDRTECAGPKNLLAASSNHRREKSMHFADRITRLGTETAFAVSAEAAAFAASEEKSLPLSYR